MTKKTKTILKNVFTFGIYGAVVKAKAKKQMNVVNEELKVSDKQLKNIEQVVEYFGGIKNIVSVDNSIYGLKVVVHDLLLVNMPLLKETLKAQGSMINGNKITINFGDNAPTVAKQIKELLNASQQCDVEITVVDDNKIIQEKETIEPVIVDDKLEFIKTNDEIEIKEITPKN